MPKEPYVSLVPNLAYVSWAGGGWKGGMGENNGTQKQNKKQKKDGMCTFFMIPALRLEKVM
jgi:hypothetical protein